MEVSRAASENDSRAKLIQGANYLICLPNQTEGQFSITVSQSEGLPPTEIYLLAGEGQQNESALEAETPAHGNLSTKEGAEEATTSLKHPRAPKNKRQASAPKKFTFDDLTPDNSFIESRDEDDPNALVKEVSHGKVDSDRDGAREMQFNAADSNLVNAMAAMVKKSEEMEHEEGAYWFAECGLPQIGEHNSFPTVPFDEDPDPAAAEFNLFCNRPPPTLTPHAVTEARICPMEDQLEPIPESGFPVDIKMKAEDEDEPAPPAISPVQNEKAKAVPPTLSPSTAAVMNMSDISCFQGDLEMAPSDELENRCTFEDCDVVETGGTDDDTMDTDDEKYKVKILSEEKGRVKAWGDEISSGGLGESNGPMDETENGVNQGGLTPAGGEDPMKQSTYSSEEEDLKGVHVLSIDDKERQKILIPSVVSPSGDSDEHVALQATAAVSMGDLRQQLDQLRVSDTLLAVSQSIKDQAFLGTEPFLGAELCGQQIMDWFGSKK